MSIWLCPVRAGSWRIIRKHKIMGFPKRSFNISSKVEVGDLIIFHVFKPVNGIVAICRVTSDFFENNSDLWGKDRYPYRVKIDFIPNLQREKNNAIPISVLFSKTADNSDFIIEPYLRNTWITKITELQFKKLKSVFKS